MSEVTRWKLKGFLPGVEGECKAVFQPTVVMAEDFDRVTAERDAALGRINELLEDFQEMSDQADRRGVQASEFEDRMGDLQVQNGKLQQRLTAANERDDALETALRKIKARLDAYAEADMRMPESSIEVCQMIADTALKPADGGGDE